MNYETAIEDIEGNSRYSVAIFLLFGIMTFTYSAEVSTLNFLSYTPTFHCDNSSFLGGNISWSKDQCHGNIYFNNGSTRTFSCHKWVYSKEVMIRTMVTDLDLVCDRSYHVTILETVVFTGIAIGGYIGIVGDTLGRKKSILLGVALEISINLILPFMTNFWIILVLRLFWGFGIFKQFQGLCYLSEIISISKRSLFSNNYYSMYTIAYMLSPAVAYGTRDWRWLKMILNIPLLVYILYLWVPESPRWLSVVGRHKEARESLVYIASKNGLQYAPERFDGLIIDTETQSTLAGALQTREMRKKLIVLLLANSAIALCYYGLTTNSHFVSENIFINVFLQGVVEIFTGPLAWISSSRGSRIVSMTSFMLITGGCLLISCLMPLSNIILTVTKATFAMLGKFFLTTCYCIMDMYMTEVFPTSVRSSANLILGTAAAASALAPTVNRLDIFGSFISSTIYAAMISSSGILIFIMLPETKGCPLPQTIYEADQLRRGNEQVYCKMMLDKDRIIDIEDTDI